jgi:glycosyltransferase involved in cell wall biosynthesis
MRLATIICTYNRAESLSRTLDTFTKIEAPGEWELIVADNNSTDDTKAVCEKYSAALPLRYCFEPARGKSSALNTAIRLATADLLTFTDDDVDVDAHWLRHLADAAERNPRTPFFAGRVVARLEGKPPRWFAENATTLLSEVAVHFDYGGHERFVDEAMGVNIAIRRDVFNSGLTFRPDLGPDGTETVRSEEVQFFQDLRASGTWQDPRGIYIPSAIVYHRTSAARTSEKYVRKWYYGDGIAMVRRGQVERGKALLGVPRYLWRKLIGGALRYLLLRPFGPASAWLREEIEAARTYGIIHEMRRQGRAQSSIKVT